jgi:hypothetical protein
MASRRKGPAFAGSVSLDGTRESDVLVPELARLGCFSLTGIDAVPLGKIKALNEKSPGLGLDTLLSRVGSSAPQQAALIGPVERQIEFGKTRRSEFDGLPALQHHLD